MSSKVLAESDKPKAGPFEWRAVALADELAAAGNLFQGAPSPAAAAEPVAEAEPEPVPAFDWQAEIDRQLQAAQAEADHQARAAYSRGRIEGEASGQQQAASQIDPVIAKLTATIQELALLRQRLRAEAEHDVVRLALEIAKRVLRRELTVDPEALLGLVKARLDRLAAHEECRVRIHPGLAPAISRLLESGGSRVEVISDAGIEMGGAILESSHGRVDLTVDAQLGEIERGFADLAPAVDR